MLKGPPMVLPRRAVRPRAIELAARAVPFFVFLLLLSFQTGCSGHSARTARMRTALDAGRPADAVAALDRELGVKDGALPEKLRGDDALLVLDRAMIQQARAKHDLSKRDYQVADKAIDVLDLSHGTADQVGRWLYSDASGRYVAPPHEKLLVNVLNMLNYLETRDLSGARVEARRMVTTSRFLRGTKRVSDPSLALGSALAGFVYEKSGELEEANRFYDDASRIRPGLGVASALDDNDTDGELLVVVGDGRVPHRIAKHVPIGLALTRASPFLAAGDRETASELAAQGLVTWINYPELAPARPLGPPPALYVGGRRVPLEKGLDVSAVVQERWRSIEGEVMAAAITRAAARVAAGKAIEGIANISDKKGVRAVGLLLSLVAQISLTVADTPDTRSWETLPARISVARVRLPPGTHDVRLETHGARRHAKIEMGRGGWAALTLFDLR